METADENKEQRRGKRQRKHKESKQENWPDFTNVVPSRLHDQGILIRSLCRDVIQILELTLVTKEAWPELHRAANAVPFKHQTMLISIQMSCIQPLS